MSTEFEIQRCTRRCATSGHELQPGEAYYSVLVSEGAEILRKDYSAESWRGAPDDVLGWWKGQVADSGTKKPQLAPHDVILNYFQELESHLDKHDTRYVLALLMIRRRILRLEETERDASGRETLVLFCSRNETEYKLPVTTPATPERVAEIQQEISRLLFAEST